MRFIRVWAYGCARYITEQLKESHQKRGIYYYGFQIIISDAVKIVALLFISLLLGILESTVVILIAFALLRSVAGGYHMETYGKCIITSLALFILAGLIAQYTGFFWHVTYVVLFTAVSFLVGLYILARWAPKDNPHKPIKQPEEIRKFKRLSYIYMLIWLTAAVLFINFKFNVITISLCFGLLLEVFTISPAGCSFFDWISGSVDTFNKNGRSQVKKRR